MSQSNINKMIKLFKKAGILKTKAMNTNGNYFFSSKPIRTAVLLIYYVFVPYIVVQLPNRMKKNGIFS